ncbi:MAG: hypothetical protein ABF391_05980, partial [Akkermansiaceae bacterium]
MKKFLLPLLLLQSSPGLQVRSYSASLHDRFLDFPSAPTANPDFIYGDVDLTGVSEDANNLRVSQSLPLASGQTGSGTL